IVRLLLAFRLPVLRLRRLRNFRRLPPQPGEEKEQKNQNQGYANVLSHRAPLLSPPVYAPLVQNMMTNDVRRAILHLVITSAPRVRGPSREMELKNENRLLYLSPPLGGWSCPLLPAAGPEPHRL